MEKEFISYEQALELKELGFDEPCFAKYYNAEDDRVPYLEIELPDTSERWSTLLCSAPLYQQAFRWFREKYEVKVISIGGDKTRKFSYLMHLKNNNQVLGEKCNTYEEAELECLKKLIEIVKSK